MIKFGPSAVPYLIPCLKDMNPVVRNKTAWTLGDIGPPAKEAVAALMDMIKDNTDRPVMTMIAPVTAIAQPLWA